MHSEKQSAYRVDNYRLLGFDLFGVGCRPKIIRVGCGKHKHDFKRNFKQWFHVHFLLPLSLWLLSSRYALDN